MDNKEGKSLLASKLSEYRKFSYEQLRDRIGQHDHLEAIAPSGTPYQLEIQVFWDDKPNGDIRVLGAIDDGRWRAFVPLCDAFIVAPDGRFVVDGVP